MKNLTAFFKTAILTVVLGGLSFSAHAVAYTAAANGNWTAASTWGVTGPAVNITSADVIVIPAGITVNLDANVIMNSVGSTLTVTGALSGSSNLSILTGTLSGAGTVSANILTVAPGGLITSTGAFTVNQLVNSSALLALTAPVAVTNSMTLSAGVVQLGAGAILTLSNNVAVNMAGGTLTATTGLLTLLGNYNLNYIDTASTMGLETAFTGLHSITVNLASSSRRLTMTSSLVLAGGLTLTQGVLALNGHDLTITGTVTTAANASIAGNVLSSVIVNGTGAVGSLSFSSANDTLHNLILNITSAGTVMLGSAVTIADSLLLNSGSLDLNGHSLTIAGHVVSNGSGSLIANTSSDINVTGMGNVGTLVFATAGNTVGSLTVNSNGAGSVSLGSDIIVSGTLVLSGGTIDLNGYNLSLTGAVNTTGTGSITGNPGSTITMNGTGNSGTLVFAAGSQTINNLILHITSAGFVTLGSNLIIHNTLNLTSGNVIIGLYNLTIANPGLIAGGSALSYIVTNDTGKVAMTLANAGATAMYPVGTMTNFAPVTITNNSSTAATFMTNARAGVLSHGTVGSDISLTQSIVNTSWNVESSLTTGANVNLTMGWNTAMQVNGFDNTHAYVSHYTNGAWNAQTATAASILGGGSFSLLLTGVTSFSPFAVFDRNTTGIATIENNKVLAIYPNPSKTMVHLGNIENNKPYHLSVYNMTGQLVMVQDASSDQLNVSDLTEGLYTISINQNGDNFVSRIMVSK